MTQVNKYTDRAAYRADAAERGTQSAVSMVESESAAIYDGVNVVVGKDAAEAGDAVVWDGANGAIRFVKGATLSVKRLPADLVPLAVVYARQGERLLIVALDNVPGKTQRWAHPYQVALSGFDLAAGGTLRLTFGSATQTVSVTYGAGATLIDVAQAINDALKNGSVNLTTSDYGGWAATAANDCVTMDSNTWNSAHAVIAVVSGCQIAFTPENKNYQTTLTRVLIEGTTEYVRRKNGVSTSWTGCNAERFIQYYAENGVDKTGIGVGSAQIIRESVFTEADNPALAAAYPSYRDYILGEHMVYYPSACGAMLRDGKQNTAKIGTLRFVNIRGESAPCYPAAAAALEYGVTVEGAMTGLEAGAWWLPSVEEIYLLMKDRVLKAADAERDPVNRTLALLGATSCYGMNYYLWTSGECSSDNAFLYGGWTGIISSNSKFAAHSVRPVSAL